MHTVQSEFFFLCVHLNQVTAIRLVVGFAMRVKHTAKDQYIIHEPQKYYTKPPHLLKETKMASDPN